MIFIEKVVSECQDIYAKQVFISTGFNYCCQLSRMQMKYYYRKTYTLICIILPYFCKTVNKWNLCVRKRKRGERMIDRQRQTECAHELPYIPYGNVGCFCWVRKGVFKTPDMNLCLSLCTCCMSSLLQLVSDIDRNPTEFKFKMWARLSFHRQLPAANSWFIKPNFLGNYLPLITSEISYPEPSRELDSLSSRLWLCTWFYTYKIRDIQDILAFRISMNIGMHKLWTSVCSHYTHDRWANKAMLL